MTERAGSCVVCRERDPRWPQVCDADRSRISRWLVEIPELYGELGTLGFVERDGRPGTRAVVLVDEAGRRRIVREPGHPADPVAHHLPPGPIAGPTAGGRVAGSKEPPVPIRLDPVDLTADARVLHLASRPSSAAPLLPCRRCRAYHLTGSYTPRSGPCEPFADQVGHLSVASVLDGWVRDWRELRDCGEGLPEPTVPVLCSWLGNRVEWACDEHPAVDEFAGELRELRSAMYGLLGLVDHPDYKQGVPCRRCNSMTLVRRNGSDWVECGECPELMSPEEYQRWVGLLAAQARQDGGS